MTEDAKYCPKPKANKVQHGGKVTADRIVGRLPMLLISKPARIVTSHSIQVAATESLCARKDRSIARSLPLATDQLPHRILEGLVKSLGQRASYIVAKPDAEHQADILLGNDVEDLDF